MKVRKETIKNYWEKHKKKFCIAAGGTICLVVGSVLGYEYCKFIKIDKGLVVTDKHMSIVISDAIEKYPKGKSVFTGYKTEPIKLDDLGELGKAIKEYGAPDEASFTHFICMGKPIKK